MLGQEELHVIEARVRVVGGALVLDLGRLIPPVLVLGLHIVARSRPPAERQIQENMIASPERPRRTSSSAAGQDYCSLLLVHATAVQQDPATRFFRKRNTGLSLTSAENLSGS